MGFLSLEGGVGGGGGLGGRRCGLSNVANEDKLSVSFKALKTTQRGPFASNGRLGRYAKRFFSSFLFFSFLSPPRNDLFSALSAITSIGEDV